MKNGEMQIKGNWYIYIIFWKFHVILRKSEFSCASVYPAIMFKLLTSTVLYQEWGFAN